MDPTFLRQIGLTSPGLDTPRWEYLTFTAAYSGSDQLGIVKMFNNQEIPDWKTVQYHVSRALTDAGQAGWELVSVMWRKTSESGFSDPVYYFKRPHP